MDRIQESFSKIRWHYADQDTGALAELEDRIVAAGRVRQLITYSDLVRGVSFNLPNLHKSPRIIDVADWQDLDRTIVGDYLGYISMRSYDRAQFFASALVVSKMDGSPGEGFYGLLKQLDLIPSFQRERAFDMWAKHVAMAHTWFSKHR